MADDYDSPWKEAIERYFADFLHFYFPAAHAQVDWSQPHEFLDQELRAVVQDAELGKRFVDKLVRVIRQGGQPEWIYLHIEIQGDAQPTFAERMFVYHYRLYDRYRQPIVSLAVLADDRPHWRPDSFQYASCGCSLCLQFPVAKLLDWIGSEARLADNGNPFALVTLAHLMTRDTCDDAHARYAAKSRIARMLYRRDWDRQQVINLFKVIDWMMRLPADLSCQFRRDLETLEKESRMPYVTSIEQLAAEEGFHKGMQQGMQQGMEQGRIEARLQMLRRVMSLRFGELPPWVDDKLRDASDSDMDSWTEAALSADAIDGVFGPRSH